ncbi:disease resistance protein Roq1-like [Lotus japonicus]|uniref:disease resistance protein Roq1-like n=1 Tax=Lotus japonicus TaxID=34305 RepID=UPI00258B60CC|nr:disease resistance protein Roq1-like [Lotus japonicus]XP_057458882.1 disease resistance protein Roq1-like [Lotus japonicus]XP_057458883.1 disease resistance protein Roq1-like [Lotus japonicus]XP_057458884.1 disease resistance protein Roq1-like [Lotus japonicus]
MAEELKSLNYDVFLSFRGEDTRHTLIKDLREKLKRKGIRVFIDDDMLKLGDVISPSLYGAIEESTVLVVVLSENYASSTWCLKELVKIMQCLKEGNRRQQFVFPIFYYVDPSHVQHQTEKYGEAMVAHENRLGKNSDQVRQWRSALREVSQLAGLHISTGNEINIVEEIVKKVKIISKPFHGKDPVGFEQRIEEVNSLLEMNLDDDDDDDNTSVCMLGIYGLKGIGKTEFAKALYSKIRHKFEAESFIANVGEKSKQANGMEELQKTLMSNMGEKSETELDSKSRRIEIQSRLGKKKILLVLDDVDHIEQLNNLAGGYDWFGSGSRIIITTRDEDMLHHHGVKKTYKMAELDDQPSLELFCQNAFGKSHPKTGYGYLSHRAVNYAKGLPLALKALGSHLATEDDLEYWECTLEEYKTNPNLVFFPI